MKRMFTALLCLALCLTVLSLPASAEYVVTGWVGDLLIGMAGFDHVDVIGCAKDVQSVTVPKKVYHVGILNYESGWPVQGIGASAFDGHATLQDVTLEDTVERIESRAFAKCSKLSQLTVYGMNVSIADDAFTGTTNVRVRGYSGSTMEAFCEAHNIRYSSIGETPDPGPGSIINADPDTVLDFVKQAGGYGVSVKDEYAGKIGSITIPAQTNAGRKIVAILDEGFWLEDSMTEITFSKGLKTIGDSAFRECTNLRSVTLPDGLTTLGEYAFRECRNMTSVTLPQTLTTAGH